jgi:hypothetical protein
MKIRILCYKAKIGDKHWMDDAISLYTGIFNWGTGPYSHVELWVPKEAPLCQQFSYTNNIHPLTTKYYGHCYTSTMRGDTKGVVKRPASEVLKHPERWDYCEIEVGENAYERMIARADYRVEINEGYDFKAIASFFWYKRIHDMAKWICSEFVWWLLWNLEIFSGTPTLCPSPRRLSRWLTKKGYVIKPLEATHTNS